ncbi:hypothetical protein BHM03_00041674 [Ensete ventricosum]|nr:hypothetical protein BHM03_00041674 [Ensete ventricosum]
MRLKKRIEIKQAGDIPHDGVEVRRLNPLLVAASLLSQFPASTSFFSSPLQDAFAPLLFLLLAAAGSEDPVHFQFYSNLPIPGSVRTRVEMRAGRVFEVPGYGTRSSRIESNV